MYTNDQLCEKIRTLYPDIGECGIDLNVEYSLNNISWVADLKKDNNHLCTFIDPDDTKACMEGKQCIGLGLQIYQLMDNINNMNYS